IDFLTCIAKEPRRVLKEQELGGTNSITESEPGRFVRLCTKRGRPRRSPRLDALEVGVRSRTTKDTCQGVPIDPCTARNVFKSNEEECMRLKRHLRLATAIVVVGLASLLVWPSATRSQLPTASTITGQATAVQATVPGFLGTANTTTLAATAPLGSSSDAEDESQLTGSVPSLLAAEALSAATIGYPDEVDSVASLGSLNLNVAGVSV